MVFIIPKFYNKTKFVKTLFAQENLSSVFWSMVTYFSLSIY